MCILCEVIHLLSYDKAICTYYILVSMNTVLTLIVPSANSVSPLKIAVENRLIHAIHKNCIVY